MTETTQPKPFVFVLMPFAREFNDIYALGIKAACEESKAYSERVDEQIFTNSILDRIFNQIAKADIIVADMTERNPNVFYETGYAHALGKQVILLTQKVDDIPFDMKHYPHITYKKTNISKLKEDLIKRIKWLVENPNLQLKAVDFGVDFFYKGNPVVNSSNLKITPVQIQVDIDKENLIFNLFEFQFEIHNSSKRTLNLSSVQVGFVGEWITGLQLDALNSYINKKDKNLSLLFNLPNRDRLINLPNDESMYLFPLPEKLLPDSWINLSCKLALGNLSKKSFSSCLRLYTEIETREILLNFSFEKPLWTSD